MNGSDQPEVVKNYFSKARESQDYLSQYGDSGKDKNNGVSLSYQHIAQNDPNLRLMKLYLCTLIQV